MTRHLVRSVFCFVIALGALGGCSAIDKGFSNNTPQVVAAPDPVSARLAEAADRVSNALETLAAVENARTPSASSAPIANAPRELRRAITVNWVGPVEPVLKMLADRAGYEFKAFGNRPSNAAVISLDVENRAIIEVMRDVGLQLGGRADVRVSGDARRVEIHYAPVDGMKAGG